mmetsp:Transcript_18886/g.28482  ORF Transcript_18886/g.28482 Transcript_18886/m.28482 type:complete len:419 (+) Transcript_18886:56-1312(+)
MKSAQTTLEVILLVFCWYLTSAASVILLKEVFKNEEDPVSTVLDATLAYLCSGVIGGWIYQNMVTIETKPINSHDSSLVLATAFDIIGTAATNWAIVQGGASLSQVFKLLEPPFTVIITFLILGEKTSLVKIGCIIITCIGVYLARHTSSPPTPNKSDASPNLSRQIIWILGLCIMTTSFPLRNVYAKRMRTSGAMAYAIICKRGLLILGPLGIGRICAMPTISSSIKQKFLYFCLASIFSAIYNLFSFKVLAHVSPVTHAQLRLGKRAFSLVISVATLHDIELTTSHSIGLFLAFAGLIGFLLVQKRTVAENSEKTLTIHTSGPVLEEYVKNSDPIYEKTSENVRERCSSKDHHEDEEAFLDKDHDIQQHLSSPSSPFPVENFANALVYGSILFFILGTIFTASPMIQATTIQSSGP